MTEIQARLDVKARAPGEGRGAPRPGDHPGRQAPSRRRRGGRGDRRPRRCHPLAPPPLTPVRPTKENPMSKLTLLTAAAVGYVLGARAGRERYEQIADGARKLAGNPRVQAAKQQAQGVVAEQASHVKDVAAEKAKETASAVGDDEAGAATTAARMPPATRPGPAPRSRRRHWRARDVLDRARPRPLTPGRQDAAMTSLLPHRSPGGCSPPRCRPGPAGPTTRPRPPHGARPAECRDLRVPGLPPPRALARGRRPPRRRRTPTSRSGGVRSPAGGRRTRAC